MTGISNLENSDQAIADAILELARMRGRDKTL
jgi:hypothetical protein